MELVALLMERYIKTSDLQQQMEKIKRKKTRIYKSIKINKNI